MIEIAVETIRTERARRGISISELARQAEVGRPYLTNVLNGHHIPSLEWVTQVLDHLDVDMSLIVKRRTRR